MECVPPRQLDSLLPFASERFPAAALTHVAWSPLFDDARATVVDGRVELVRPSRMRPIRVPLLLPLGLRGELVLHDDTPDRWCAFATMPKGKDFAYVRLEGHTFTWTVNVNKGTPNHLHGTADTLVLTPWGVTFVAGEEETAFFVMAPGAAGKVSPPAYLRYLARFGHDPADLLGPRLGAGGNTLLIRGLAGSLPAQIANGSLTPARRLRLSRAIWRVGDAVIQEKHLATARHWQAWLAGSPVPALGQARLVREAGVDEVWIGGARVEEDTFGAGGATQIWVVAGEKTTTWVASFLPDHIYTVGMDGVRVAGPCAGSGATETIEGIQAPVIATHPGTWSVTTNEDGARVPTHTPACP